MATQVTVFKKGKRQKEVVLYSWRGIPYPTKVREIITRSKLFRKELRFFMKMGFVLDLVYDESKNRTSIIAKEPEN